MFHNQEDFEHLYSNDNYANNISHDDDIFGNDGYDDIAEDKNIDGLHDGEDNTHA